MGLNKTTAVLVIAFCCWVVVCYLIVHTTALPIAFLAHILYTIASCSIHIILNCSDFMVCNIYRTRRTYDALPMIKVSKSSAMHFTVSEWVQSWAEKEQSKCHTSDIQMIPFAMHFIVRVSECRVEREKEQSRRCYFPQLQTFPPHRWWWWWWWFWWWWW